MTDPIRTLADLDERLAARRTARAIYSQAAKRGASTRIHNAFARDALLNAGRA